MRFKKRERVFFFMLEETIFQRLKKEVTQHNLRHPKGSGKFVKIDVACFFIHIIDKRRTLLGEEVEDGYVHLMSKILKKYHYDYSRYISFLKKNGFIEVTDGYSTFKGKSKRYKVLLPKEPVEPIIFIPEDFTFSKKIMKIDVQERRRADRSCRHLTKWLHPDYLYINRPKAIKMVNDLQAKGLSNEKVSKRQQKIELISKGYISYKREGKDNRLHSVLTNLSKDLRPYLRFKRKQSLISSDLKSSQPFMLAGLINLIINQDKYRIEECVKAVKGIKRRRDILSNINMWKENLSDLEIIELKAFIKLVLEDDIYSYVGRKFSSDFQRKKFFGECVIDKFYCEQSESKKEKLFMDIRDYCKVVFLEYLYSSNSNNEERIKEVRRILPDTVNRLVSDLKKHNKRDFPIFLQNLESYLLIDKITKEFSKKYPKAPLYTIHDSVATTKKYSELVRCALEQGLKNFFGIKPQVVPEKWIRGDQAA